MDLIFRSSAKRTPKKKKKKGRKKKKRRQVSGRVSSLLASYRSPRNFSPAVFLTFLNQPPKSVSWIFFYLSSGKQFVLIVSFCLSQSLALSINSHIYLHSFKPVISNQHRCFQVFVSLFCFKSSEFFLFEKIFP